MNNQDNRVEQISIKENREIKKRRVVFRLECTFSLFCQIRCYVGNWSLLFASPFYIQNLTNIYVLKKYIIIKNACKFSTFHKKNSVRPYGILSIF